MKLGKSKVLQLATLGLLSGLTFATAAQAQWRDDRHGPVFRDDRARFEHRVVVRDWHFDRGHGWRSSLDRDSGPRITSGGGPAAGS